MPNCDARTNSGAPAKPRARHLSLAEPAVAGSLALVQPGRHAAHKLLKKTVLLALRRQAVRLEDLRHSCSELRGGITFSRRDRERERGAVTRKLIKILESRKGDDAPTSTRYEHVASGRRATPPPPSPGGWCLLVCDGDDYLIL